MTRHRRVRYWSATMTLLSNMLWVALGGAIGSAVRYLVSLGAVRWFGSHWPVGTLMVNIAGSLLLGVLLQLFATMDGLHPGLRLKLTTGLMGGLTTYSTFNYEILAMMESGRLPAAAVYMVLTLASCLVAGGVGMAGVRWLGPS